MNSAVRHRPFPEDSPTAPRVLPVSFLTAPLIEIPPASSHHVRVLAAAVSILGQGETLLSTLTPAHYATRVPAVFNGSIGGHYRHCLDHFSSVLNSVGTDAVDYDHRERDPRQETVPSVALHVTRDLRARFNLLPVELLSRPVTTRCEVSYAPGDSPATHSSFSRELAYCIAHTIHHFALIAVIAKLLEVPLPENFGVAPSTVAHLNGAHA